MMFKIAATRPLITSPHKTASTGRIAPSIHFAVSPHLMAASLGQGG
jgi:hypothetical protein